MVRQRGDSPSQLGFLEGVKAGLWLIPYLPTAHTQRSPRRASGPLPGFGLGGGRHRLYRHKLHQQLERETAADHMQEFLGAKLSGL